METILHKIDIDQIDRKILDFLQENGGRPISNWPKSPIFRLRSATAATGGWRRPALSCAMKPG
jgi:hypothetical protein